MGCWPASIGVAVGAVRVVDGTNDVTAMDFFPVRTGAPPVAPVATRPLTSYVTDDGAHGLGAALAIDPASTLTAVDRLATKAAGASPAWFAETVAAAAVLWKLPPAVGVLVARAATPLANGEAAKASGAYAELVRTVPSYPPRVLLVAMIDAALRRPGAEPARVLGALGPIAIMHPDAAVVVGALTKWQGCARKRAALEAWSVARAHDPRRRDGQRNGQFEMSGFFLFDAVKSLAKPFVYVASTVTGGLPGLLLAWGSDKTGVMDAIGSVAESIGGVILDVLTSPLFLMACAAVSSIVGGSALDSACMLLAIGIEVAEAIDSGRFDKLPDLVGKGKRLAALLGWDADVYISGLLETILQPMLGVPGAIEKLVSGGGLEAVRRALHSVGMDVEEVNKIVDKAIEHIPGAAAKLALGGGGGGGATRPPAPTGGSWPLEAGLAGVPGGAIGAAPVDAAARAVRLNNYAAAAAGAAGHSASDVIGALGLGLLYANSEQEVQLLATSTLQLAGAAKAPWLRDLMTQTWWKIPGGEGYWTDVLRKSFVQPAPTRSLVALSRGSTRSADAKVLEAANFPMGPVAPSAALIAQHPQLARIADATSQAAPLLPFAPKRLEVFIANLNALGDAAAHGQGYASVVQVDISPFAKLASTVDSVTSAFQRGEGGGTAWIRQYHQKGGDMKPSEWDNVTRYVRERGLYAEDLALGLEERGMSMNLARAVAARVQATPNPQGAVTDIRSAIANQASLALAHTQTDGEVNALAGAINSNAADALAAAASSIGGSSRVRPSAYAAFAAAVSARRNREAQGAPRS